MRLLYQVVGLLFSVNIVLPATSALSIRELQHRSRNGVTRSWRKALRYHFSLQESFEDKNFYQSPLFSSADEIDMFADAIANQNNMTALERAAALRRRAREIMEEVKTMEAAMEAARSAKQKQRDTEYQNMYQRLFPANEPSVSAEGMARILREERCSVDQLIPILKTLYKRQREMSIVDAQSKLLAVVPNKMNQTQMEMVDLYIQSLLEAAAILDKETGDTRPWERRFRWSGRGENELRTQLKEWRRVDEEEFKRRVAVDVQAAMKSNTTVQRYMKQALGLPVEANNTTQTPVNMTVTVIPFWVPSSLLKFIVAARTLLSPDDIKVIKERVLPASRFFCTSSDSIPVAAIFRGNMRTAAGAIVKVPLTRNSTVAASIFAEIEQLMQREQLSSRVQLFLMPDPEWVPHNRDSREAAPEPKPVILALPRAVVPDERKLKTKRTFSIAKKASVVVAMVTSFFLSVKCYSLNSNFFDSVVKKQDSSALMTCIPIVVGILAVQAVHEIAHCVVAKSRGIEIGRPIPIPSTELGLFGCITPLRSFPNNRSSLLDWSLSGPVAGLVFSVLLMIIGINRTVHASQHALLRFPVVPNTLFKMSFLTGSLITFLAPKIMMLPVSQPIPIHPFFMVGFFGSLASALNLLPIFRLDGGRACSAAMGRRFSAVASAWASLLILSAAISGSDLAFYLCIVTMFIHRQPEVPVRDEITQVSDVRLGTWIASVIASVLALAPFPGGTGLL